MIDRVYKYRLLITKQSTLCTRKLSINFHRQSGVCTVPYLKCREGQICEVYVRTFTVAENFVALTEMIYDPDLFVCIVCVLL